MRTLTVLGALLFAGLSTPAMAADPSGGTLGVGLASGASSYGFGGAGLSLKKYAGSTAYQGVVRLNNNYIGVGADFLLEQPSFADLGGAAQLGWNYGLGANVGLGNNYLGLGASGVVGLEVLFQPLPIDLVLEYRPGAYILPGFALDLVNFSGHLRYYFG